MKQVKLKVNDQCGLVPRTKTAARRAAKADLGTLPVGMSGTNCANCEYATRKQVIKEGGADVIVAFCAHTRVEQYVTHRMCCAFWSAPGFLRVGDKPKAMKSGL